MENYKHLEFFNLFPVLRDSQYNFFFYIVLLKYTCINSRLNSTILVLYFNILGSRFPSLTQVIDLHTLKPWDFSRPHIIECVSFLLCDKCRVFSIIIHLHISGALGPMISCVKLTYMFLSRVDGLEASYSL